MTKRTWGWLGALLLISGAALANQKTVNAILQSCQIIGGTITGATLTASSIDSTPIGRTAPSTIVGSTVTGNSLVQGDVVNAGVDGFQQNGTAPNGHTLCGNGNFYKDCAPVLPNVTYADVAAGRALGGVYRNTSGAALEVAVTASISGSYGQGFGITGSIGSSAGSLTPVATAGVGNSQGQATLTFLVPSGYYYTAARDDSYVSNPQQPAVRYWAEYTF